MKRTWLISILLGLGVIAALAQDSIVSIPDTVFLYALIDEGVDTNGDSLISQAEAEAVVSLNVNNRSISSMTGIEAFLYLDTLNCGNNDFTSLDLTGNPGLKFLDCHGSPFGSPLTSLNVSNNTALTELICHYNHLTSLDVYNNTELRELICCSGQLTSLDVSNNRELTNLNCCYNHLTSLDVSNTTTLKKLNCESNQLTSLDVSNHAELTLLNCYNNQLTSLDASGCIALTQLTCVNNQLTWLDVSGCIALRWLTCGKNQLTSLDLCDNDSIRSLSLGDMPTLDTVYVWASFPAGVGVGTTGSPNVVFIECAATGWAEYNKDECYFYPNPTDNLLTIETNNPDHYSIEITTLNGKLVFNTEMEGTSHQLDLSSFQKGVYLITIRSEDLVTTRKIIKY